VIGKDFDERVGMLEDCPFFWERFNVRAKLGWSGYATWEWMER
jgi:hypothetical protein